GPAGVTLTLKDSTGNTITGTPQGSGGVAFLFSLTAGKYVVKVSGWTATQTGVAYQLNVSLATSGDNPPPLTVGPAPAIALKLAGVPDDPPTVLRVNSSHPADVVSPLTNLAAVGQGFGQTDVSASILLTRTAGPVGERASSMTGAVDQVIVRADDLPQ